MLLLRVLFQWGGPPAAPDGVPGEPPHCKRRVRLLNKRKKQVHTVQLGWAPDVLSRCLRLAGCLPGWLAVWLGVSVGLCFGVFVSLCLFVSVLWRGPFLNSGPSVLARDGK